MSGAERLKKPDKIVFVANDEGKQRIFQGWANSADLLQQLLKENEQYQRSFYAAKAAAKQWEIYGPLDKNPPNTFYQPPPPPVWVQSRIATNHSWMAFSNQTGLPNELLAEQYLQNELGNEIEQKPEGSRHISISRLNELFKPVLIKQTIDTTWTNEQQTDTFFSSDASFLALTENGRYTALVSRVTLINEALKSVFNNKDK